MRIVAYDQRAQQVKNSFINPSFEKAAVATYVERARNLVADPRATAYGGVSGQIRWTIARWFGSGATAGVYSLVTGASDGPVGITTYARKTWTAVPTVVGNSGDTGFQIGNSGNAAFAVQPGETYTFSGYMRSSTSRSVVMNLYFWNASGAAASVARAGSAGQITVAGGPWVRVSYVTTVPNDTYFITVVLDSNASGSTNYVVGDTLDATGLLVTKGKTLLSYFDGTTTPGSVLGGEYTFAWAGTANASQSIATGPIASQEHVRNLVTNPKLTSTLTGWTCTTGTGGAASFARVADGTGPYAKNFARATWSTVPTGGNPGINFGADIPIAATDVVNCTIKVRCSSAISIFVVLDWYDSGGAYISQNLQTISLAANTWTTFNLAPTPVVGTVKIVPHIRFSSIPSMTTGLTLDATMACIVKSVVTNLYFDGDFVEPLNMYDDLDFVRSWTGAADASESVIKVTAPSATAFNPQRLALLSMRNAVNGAGSWRITPWVRGVITSTDNFGELSSGAGNYAKVKPDTLYTVMGYVTTEQAMSGPTATGPLNFRASVITAGGTVEITGWNRIASAVPGTPGTYLVRATFRTPSTALSWNFIRVQNGYVWGQGDCWWDQVCLIEGNYRGQIVDPSQPGGKWLGAPHASESVIYPTTAG